LTGNRQFADDFFDQYVEGRDVVEYAKLFERAGYRLSPRSANTAWAGQVAIQQGNGGLVVGAGGRGGLVPFGTPAYEAGIDSGDVIVSIDGAPATMSAWSALAENQPGDRVALVIRRRDGATVTRTMTLKPDPALQLTDMGTAMTAAQKAFRESWLGTKVKEAN
jgi:predicted metalloprotease with PDZ domain